MDLQQQAINIASSAVVGLGVGVGLSIAPSLALGFGATCYLVDVYAFQALYHLNKAPVDDEIPNVIRYTGNASITLAWPYTASKVVQHVSPAVFSAPILLPSAFILSATSIIIGPLYIAPALKERRG